MPFYVDDYLRDTQHLNVSQHGMYVLILINMWRYGGSLHLCSILAGNVLHVDRRTATKNWQVLQHFFRVDGDIVTQPRLTAELEKAAKICGKRSEVATERWARRKQSMNAIASAPVKQLQDASVLTLQNNTEESPIVPLPKPESRSPDGFAEFWVAYPRKVGKGAAEKAWRKVREPLTTLAKIKQALRWQCKSHDWTKENGQYIPHPATYLNGRRWEDSPDKKPAQQQVMNGFVPMTDDEERRISSSWEAAPKMSDEEKERIKEAWKINES